MTYVTQEEDVTTPANQQTPDPKDVTTPANQQTPDPKDVTTPVSQQTPDPKDDDVTSTSTKQPKKSTKQPKNISSDLDMYLREVAKSWRTLRRKNDRDMATLLLQLALASIPKRSGRVSEWLGPSYFDEELPITRGCQVRILREADPAKFRNAYKYTKIVGGNVNLVGTDFAEVSVREKFGLKVVIKNRAGEEQVLHCGELKQCAFNPHKKRNDPSVSALYHAWNRKQVQRLQVGSTIEHMCDKKWVTARIVRVVRGANPRDVVYTVAKERLINAKSIKLSSRTVKWARDQNKLWSVSLSPCHVTTLPPCHLATMP